MNVITRKEYLTVSEMAALCKVSAATLKHYEKIDLIKPARVDKYTLYRYYSIYQYERIETIRELRELGMSLAAIKEYMNDRNVGKSLDILKKQYSDVSESIKNLVDIRDNMKKQINLIEKCCGINLFTIRKEYFPEREMILYDTQGLEDLTTRMDIDFCYAILTLETDSGRDVNAATLARGRIGLLIPKEEIQSNNLTKSYPFILLNESTGKKNKLLEGEYVCLMHRGESRNRIPCMNQLLAYIDAHDYNIAGDAVQVSLVDETMSDSPVEHIFDIQIPIEGGNDPI